jgi:hypothetical protein
MCFTLRLHMSAAPPRVGLTQALGPMKKTTASGQKAFLERLNSNRDKRVSTTSVLWSSRLALLQWVFVFAVAALFLAHFFGSTYASNVLATGLGFFLGLLLYLRDGLKSWPWLAQVIDWRKVEQLLAEKPQDVA